FHHSANYRSAVVHGVARVVSEPGERDQVLSAFVDKVAPGRSQHTRPPNAKELSQTVLLALDLDEVSVKVRTGGPVDDDEDQDLPLWSGVMPLSTVRGIPQPAGPEPLPEHLLRSS
nr:pyridoxamine 5'-phosphate oxidase family protein [Longispora sp. (in: high G+C Gram-positive bacteria)]